MVGPKPARRAGHEKWPAITPGLFATDVGVEDRIANVSILNLSQSREQTSQ